MIKHVSLLALCLLVFGKPVWAQNPNGPLYTIHGAGNITIDGDTSDWSTAEWVTYDGASVSSTGGMNWNDSDAVCTFAMVYDTEALYLGARVQDNVLSFNVDTTQPFEWWTRDGVSWFFDFTGNPSQEIILYPDVFTNFENNPGQNWLPGEMIIVIGAIEDQTHEMANRWPVGTRDGDRSDSWDFTQPDGSVARGEKIDAMESVVVIDGSNYTIEARIPWTALERSTYYSDPEDPSTLTPEELDQLGWELMLPNPLAGSNILFTNLVLDSDLPEGGFDSQIMWVGDGDIDTNWTIATFAEITGVQDWPVF